MLTLLGWLFIIAGAVCSIIVLIHAFQNEIWKGIVSLLCGLYWLYYAIVEFDHQHKWLIVGGALAGSLIGGALIGAGAPRPVPGVGAPGLG